MNDASDQPERFPGASPMEARIHRDLAERTADLAASEAANETLRQVNAALARSQATLAAREAQLRLALDAARMANWEWQVKGDRVTGSPGREALYGRAPGTLDTIAAVLAAIHPEDRHRAAATIQRALERPPGEAVHEATEFRVIDPDGMVRWLRSQGGVTEWDPVTGQALRAAGVTWDITERHRAEEGLRDAEARYRTLFDAAPFGVLVLDPASQAILDANGQACAEYGHPREALLRMRVDDLAAPERVGGAATPAPPGEVRPGMREFETRHRLASGAVRDLLVRLQTVRLNGREVDYAAHVDITARKQAESWLAQGAAILEATPDLVAMADARTGRVTFLNAAFRRVLALPPDAEIGRIALIEDCHPPEVARLLREVALPGAAREGSWTGEGAVLPRDGRPAIPVSHVLLAHRGPEGTVESFAVIMRDLSEHKRAEEERLLLAREVDHRAKNALAVVQSALRLTPRDDVDAFVRAVEGRVMALARAHTLLAETRWSGAALDALVRAELGAFLPGSGGDRAATGLAQARVEGPALLLAPSAAQAVSMALHELATNAAKHGALSVPEGRIAVSWSIDRAAGLLRLRWHEGDGPPLGIPPARRGFGSRVMQATVEEQLGGSVDRHWERDGLMCDLTLPLARILPPPAEPDRIPPPDLRRPLVSAGRPH